MKFLLVAFWAASCALCWAEPPPALPPLTSCESKMVATRGMAPLNDLQMQAERALDRLFEIQPKPAMESGFARYYVTFASDASLQRLVDVLSHLKVNTTLFAAINEVSPEVSSELQNFEVRIRQLKAQELLAETIARREHGDVAHLEEVRATLLRFGFGRRDSTLGLIENIVAWLHDLLKETHMQRSELDGQFDPMILNIAQALITQENPLFKPYEKQWIYAAQVGDVEGGLLAKLVERLTMTEDCIHDISSGKLGVEALALRTQQLRRYIEEYPMYQHYYREGRVLLPLWAEMDATYQTAKALLRD